MASLDSQVKSTPRRRVWGGLVDILRDLNDAGDVKEELVRVLELETMQTLEQTRNHLAFNFADSKTRNRLNSPLLDALFLVLCSCPWTSDPLLVAVSLSLKDALLFLLELPGSPPRPDQVEYLAKWAWIYRETEIEQVLSPYRKERQEPVQDTVLNVSEVLHDTHISRYHDILYWIESADGSNEPVEFSFLGNDKRFSFTGRQVFDPPLPYVAVVFNCLRVSRPVRVNGGWLPVVPIDGRVQKLVELGPIASWHRLGHTTLFIRNGQVHPFDECRWLPYRELDDYIDQIRADITQLVSKDYTVVVRSGSVCLLKA